MQVYRSSLIALAVAATACSSPSGVEPCDGAARSLSGNVCLDLDAAGGLTDHVDIIEAEVERTLAAARALVPVTDLRVRIIDDPGRVIPEIGLGGFATGPGEVRIFGDSRRADVEAAIRAELMGQLAHEIHHALRMRTVGYGSTLFQAAISEGLADHFALDLTGRPPSPWSVALTPAQLDEWLPRVIAGTTGSYDHDAWFFGSAAIPRWTGYATGFALVGSYLETHPGAHAAGLIGEPAASFLP